MNTRLVELRKTLNLTQAKFAEKLNLSQPLLGRIETGSRGLTDRTIADICREFDVNEEWLRTGAGEMFETLSPNEELGAFFGKVLRGDDQVKSNFLLALSRLDEKHWNSIETLLDEYVAINESAKKKQASADTCLH